MTISGTNLIPAGLLAIACVPVAFGQVVPVAAQDAVRAISAPVEVTTSEPMAVHPPKVVCSGDQLTISANNSTLESILMLVRGCTGARMDIPESAGRARTFEELGPGPIRKVLDDLLSGTEFNYVIQSSDAAPQRVEIVTLSVRKNEAPGASGPNSLDAPSSEIAMTPARKRWLSMQKFDKPDPSNPEQDIRPVSDASVPAVSGVETPAGVSSQDSQKSAENVIDSAAASPAPPPLDTTSVAPPVKATEEKITSMQQLFDQRREMIQKQSAASTAAPGATPN